MPRAPGGPPSMGAGVGAGEGDGLLGGGADGGAPESAGAGLVDAAQRGEVPPEGVELLDAQDIVEGAGVFGDRRVGGGPPKLVEGGGDVGEAALGALRRVWGAGATTGRCRG